MKFLKSIFDQLKFVIFIFVKFNWVFYPLWKIWLGILSAKFRKLEASMAVEDWDYECIQFGYLKLTNGVLNRIVGWVLEEVVASAINLSEILLSFISFFLAMELGTLGFVL